MANATRLALGAVVGVGAVARDAGAEDGEEGSTRREESCLPLLIDAETSVDGDPGSDDPAMIVDSSDPFVEIIDDSVD